VRILRFSL